MLILDLIVLALIALGAISGHKKGLVGVVVGFAALVLSIVIAFMFQSVVADSLYEMGMGSKINTIVSDNMQKMIDNGESIEDSFYGSIISTVTSDTQVEQASQAVTKFVMKGISFVVIFLVVHIICYILRMILNIVFDLPILKSINSVGGTAVGMLGVLIRIWIALAILSFIAPLPAFGFISDYINQTILIKFMFEHNVLVAIIKSGLKI